MAFSDDSPEGSPTVSFDNTALTSLADVASQQVPLPPSIPSSNTTASGLASLAGAAAVARKQLEQRSVISYTQPTTGKKWQAVFVSKDDTILSPEFLGSFDDVIAIDDNAQPLENSDETVAKWMDGLRRSQAYRGRGYATDIIELGAEEAREKAEKAAKEKEERERTKKEEMEAKEKAEKGELERKKKMKEEAKKGEARKRKESKKGAAARRRHFQADIKAQYDLDMAVARASDEE
jgi:hypothetical protein